MYLWIDSCHLKPVHICRKLMNETIFYPLFFELFFDLSDLVKKRPSQPVKAGSSCEQRDKLEREVAIEEIKMAV
nr:hypothetical protein [Tanacetum cinerariifolium]